MGQKTAFAVILAFSLSMPAAANLRAPRQVDGMFSGTLKTGPIPGSITLLGEKLRIEFPRLDTSRVNPGDPVWVTAVYEFRNASAQPVNLPVRFVALDIRDITASLDGRTLEIQIVESPADKAECLAALGSHRKAFLPDFYRTFLDRPKDPGIPFMKLFPRTFEDEPTADFPAAEFLLPLPPGKSSLTVSYGQRMFIEERNHGYFASWPSRGFSGFDYLLYPARSWPLDPAFALDLSLEVPDMRVKRFFVRVYKRPFVKCNLALNEGRVRPGRIRTFQAGFKGLPADVLTVLLYANEDAARHLR